MKSERNRRRSVARPRRNLRSLAAGLLVALTVSAALAASALAISPGDILTAAGNGSSTFSGDGGPATSAGVVFPAGVELSASGEIYSADFGDDTVRKVSPGGTITTVAGRGRTAGSSGDGGQATLALLNQPADVALDAAGNLYIADYGNHRVRKVTPGGTITAFAGTGSAGNTGNGGPATSARLTSPAGLAFDASGNLYIADSGANVVRKVTPGGTISTVAGTGTSGYSGDGGAATFAKLKGPTDASFDSAGNFYIADDGNNRVRKVSTTGVITTYAGTGTAGYSGDGGSATSAKLTSPVGVEVDAAGAVIIAAYGNNAIRRVSPGGIISTIAGTGTAGYSGDGGSATLAKLNQPARAAIAPTGDLYIADSGNNRVRMIVGAGALGSPTLASSSPPSPANQNAPLIQGSAPAGTTVKLYTNSTCTAAVAASGSDTTFASPGISVSVADNSATTFYATATDVYGRVSACSTTSLTYVEDSTAPAAPAITSAPASPGNGRSPTWSFTGEAGASFQCRLTTGATVVLNWAPCSSTQSYDLSTQFDGTYTFAVRAIDQAGNVGAAATSDYTLDTTAPAAPTITASPTSPGNSTAPSWSFSGESGAGFQCRLTSGATVVSDWSSCSSPQGFDLSGRPDGTYSFSVRAIDQAGNVGAAATSDYTLDTTAPAAPTITASPTSPGNSTAPSWSFSGESGAGFQCRLTSGATVVSDWSSCSSPQGFDLSGRPDGTYSFSVRATDQSGNTGPAATSDYTLDTTAPAAPTITASPAAVGNSATPMWSFSGESGATLTCRLVRGSTVISDWTACTSPQVYDLSSQPDATYTFSVRATDQAGNTGPAATSDYTLDTTAPSQPTITFAPSALGNSATPMWGFSGDAGATFACRLARGTTLISNWAPCTSPTSYDLTGDPDGTYTFSVRAVDAAGNNGPAAASDYGYDTTPPGAPTITSSPGASGSGRTPSWNFSGEAGATFQCQLSSGATTISAYTACSGTTGYDLTGDPDGTYTFSVRAIDSAGNTGPASTSDYKLDSTAPAAPTVASGPGPIGSSRSPSWSFTGDAGSTFACQLSSGATIVSAFGACSSPASYSLIGEPDGTYTFSVHQLDAANNPSADATDSYVLDTTAPAAPSIDTSPTSPGNTSSISWSFSGEAGASFECELSRGSTVVSSFSSCSGTRSYDISGQPDGTYTFSVRATDSAGNTGPASTSDYGYDTTAPAPPSIDSGPGALGSDRTPSWSFSGEANASFRCQLTRGLTVISAYSPCTSPASYDLSGLPDGDYTFSVRATDGAGNTGSPASSNYTLDTAAPAAPSFTSTPGSVGSVTSPSWSFTGEAGATFECELSRGSTIAVPRGACTSSFTSSLAGQPDGTYTLLVRAVDAAGNTGPDASSSYTLDTTAPAAPSIDTQPASPGNTASPTWAFSGEAGASFQCQLTRGSTVVSPYSSCVDTRSYDLTGDPEGTYTFSVRATDAAGNTGPAATSDYIYETTAPGPATIDSGPGALGNDTAPTWSFSGDPGSGFQCALTRGSTVVLPYAPCASPQTFDLSNQPDGTYTFSVRAVDAAGNTSSAATSDYQLDTTPPATPSIDSAPSSPGNDRAPSWSFSSDPGATFECEVDSGGTVVSPLGPCSSPFTESLLAQSDGDYTLTVHAVDAAGNKSADAQSTYRLDTTAPAAPTITSSPSNGPSTNPSWSFTGEAGAVFECELTSGSTVVVDLSTCSSPNSYDLSGDPDGDYTLAVHAVDAAGNVGPDATSTYTLSRSGAGVPTITSSPGATGNDDQPAWDFSGPSGSTFECSISSGSTVIEDFAPCTGPRTYDLSGQPDGTYTFSVRSVDALGNTSAPATADYALDRTPPATPTVTSTPGPLGLNQRPAWDFTGESGVRFECRLARGSTLISDFATCTGPYSYDLSGQPDGTYTFSVRAVDSAGNTSSPASDDYTLDTTAPPVPTITSAPPAVGRGTSPAWGFTVPGDGTPECRLNRGDVVLYDFASCASPSSYDLSGEPDGSYTFSVRAVDAAGNVSAPASSPYGLDRFAPASPTITSAPTSPGHDQRPSFSFTGDSDASLQCRLWQAPAVAPQFSPCGSPKTYDLTASPDGSYTFGLNAVDQAGNVSGEVNYVYLLDTTPPAAPTIVDRPASNTADDTPTWKFTGEAGATFTCSLTSGGSVIFGRSACKGKRGYDLSNQSDGDYTFHVRATDLAGNTGPSARDTFTLNRKASSGAASPSNSSGQPAAPAPAAAPHSTPAPAASPPNGPPSAHPRAATKGASAGRRPTSKPAPHGRRTPVHRAPSRPAKPGPGRSRHRAHLKHHGLGPTLTQVARITGKVAAHSAFPLGLLLLVFVFMALQNRIDRNDPKLALAPVFADPELDFVEPQGGS